jgi:photosystem II stability/assembly factor-like uncharacterized protein
MKKIFLLISIFYLLLSCDRYPDPAQTLIENYSFSFQNVQGSKLEAGEYIDVVFRAYNLNDPTEDSLKVFYEVVSGNGNITNETGYTDAGGQTYTRWTLGTTSNEQKLRASTFDQDGKFLTSSNLIAYGFIDDEWNTISTSPDGNITDIATDTVNNITIALTYGMLYKQGDRYYDWIEIANPVIASPRTINIDKNGVFYTSNYSGSLYKSTDHGNSWNTCTKPYADVSDIIYVNITGDNYIWVYNWGHKTRFSKDGGNSWQDVGSGMEQGFGDIFRLKDGSLLYHGSDCCSLWRSFDETQTWEKIETPGFSAKLFVDENDMITLITQENGTSIYNSIDYGVNFTKVHSVNPIYGTSMENIISKWKDTYYVLIPGWGILKSKDLIQYEDYWTNSALRSIFIDHNGVLIARELSSNTIHYKQIQ